MKATFLLRQNIRALLRARGQKDSDLAQWCKKSRAWISKILAEDRDDRTKVRELNVRDLDCRVLVRFAGTSAAVQV